MRAQRLSLALLASIVVTSVAAGAAAAAPALPVLWTAGGLDAGTTGAGQAARIASDPAGNVAVVSGPAGADLAVTSYTATGALRWRRTVAPSIGTFAGDWVAAAPNGDVVAVGHNVTSRGAPIALTLVRFASDGALRWRVDLARTAPAVGRLLVDGAGNAYLAFNSAGDGQDIQLHKYSPAGTLLWTSVIQTGFFANDVATSLALSPDQADVVLTGNVVGGATWIVAAYDTATGARRWLVTSPEGITLRDVVVDATRVYVTGQGVTGAGTPAVAYWLTVVAYDRSTGARLWRTDKKAADATDAAGLRIALAPGGGVVVAGQTSRGFLDWYTVALAPNGAVRWEAVRDGGLNTNEIPAGISVLADGTTVVTGIGGPNLPGGFIQGVTAGYGTSGTLLWESFARMATVWETALPTGDVCATGGYDALVTCWRPTGVVTSPPAVPPAAPTNLTATSPGRSSITLQWTNASTSQTTITIERCPTAGCTTFTEIATVSGTATGFTDSGLSRRTTYRYRVRAHNAAGDSSYSNTATARTRN
jgi:Fibronectin type III domain